MGKYVRLVDFGSQTEKEKAFLSAVADKGCDYVFDCQTEDFNKIPGSSISYWVSERNLENFSINNKVNDFVKPTTGLSTSDNNRFTREWFEVCFCKIGLDVNSYEEVQQSLQKWFPFCKGGGFKKWYGFYEIVVNWENDGRDVMGYAAKLYGSPTRTVKNRRFYFQDGLTWSALNSYKFSVREMKHAIFGGGGYAVLSINENILSSIFAFLNSKLADKFLSLISPTLNYEAGHICALPLVFKESKKPQIDKLVQECIDISKADWDSFETSWDFVQNPMIAVKHKTTYKTNGVESFLIEDAYWHYKNITEANFMKLKSNEEELNRLFIDIYGLQDELTADVADRDVTVARIFDTKAEIPESMKGNRYVMTKTDVVKDFVSYAVGCMFGRYSPYKDGLIFAGGEFSMAQFQDACVGAINTDKNLAGKMFMPNIANIIPLTDKDYFENDIISRFCEFLAEVYGKETLEQNLTFIAQSVGVKGNTSRDMIRNYFINDFYTDHIKKYKKRPIYWQLDSGKCGGFKALFYLHRFDENTLPTARVDYLHELQFKYNFEIERLKKDLEKQNLTTADKTAISKQINTLAEKVKETLVYDQVLNHACNLRIKLDLDDGVKTNYNKLQDLDGTNAIGLLTNIKM